ncbi:MAG: triose-phosphate isomerase family protein, partial [bacterium]
DELNRKIKKALKHQLKAIFCVGEKLEERQNGLTRKVVEEQLRQGLAGVTVAAVDNLVIAYEPVWAIGTGVNATPEQAEDVHQFIRELLTELFSVTIGEQIRIQYGGSVKPANAQDLLSQPNIDGALVGGASLDADSFTEIIKAAENVN